MLLIHSLWVITLKLFAYIDNLTKWLHSILLAISVYFFFSTISLTSVLGRSGPWFPGDRCSVWNGYSRPHSFEREHSESGVPFGWFCKWPWILVWLGCYATSASDTNATWRNCHTRSVDFTSCGRDLVRLETLSILTVLAATKLQEKKWRVCVVN